MNQPLDSLVKLQMLFLVMPEHLHPVCKYFPTFCARKCFSLNTFLVVFIQVIWTWHFVFTITTFELFLGMQKLMPCEICFQCKWLSTSFALPYLFFFLSPALTEVHWTQDHSHHCCFAPFFALLFMAICHRCISALWYQCLVAVPSLNPVWLQVRLHSWILGFCGKHFLGWGTHTVCNAPSTRENHQCHCGCC